MNEFSLIDVYFKQAAIQRDDVIFGIGDDAACVEVPANHQLVISTDTLVAEVHFLSSWDPFDIACKAVMMNVSDIAAMGAQPCWLSLALTLPSADSDWLARFSQGLHASLKRFNIMLIGGDTTRGPLSMTLTIHGLVAAGKAIRRSGAKPGDIIMVSGELGAAALAVSWLHQENIDEKERALVMKKLQHPCPRIDLVPVLSQFASAAIDISDGLSADLNHLCTESGVRAVLDLDEIPLHPLVKKHLKAKAVDFALSGGDDYELCFTVPAERLGAMKQALESSGLCCYPIGRIEAGSGLYAIAQDSRRVKLTPTGYSHF